MRVSFIVVSLALAVCAAWAEERLGHARDDARNPIRQIFKGERLDLWSLQPISSPALPAVKSDAWVRQPIDRFIAQKLDAAGLAPAPEADRRTLGRRLYFDVTGLPPSPEELRCFIEDTSADAYEKLVERLLQSPGFGEHWARMWLDVTRYSDSNGYDWDEFRPQAWKFRDYVIRSFNQDKPFDRFIHEQLAGDEMLAGAPGDSAEQDCLIATGYLRVGPWDNSSKLFGEEHKTRAQLLADLTETTASALLGSTFTCCRCHDHKTEPFSQADHYRLRAFFAGVQFADDLPLDLAPAQEEIRRHNETHQVTLKEAQSALELALKPAKERLRAERKAKPDEKIPDEDARKALTDAEKPAVETADKTISAAKKELRPFATGLLARETDAALPVMHILSLGDPDQRLDPVEPGIPSFFDPNPASIEKPAAPKSSGRRTALARWLTSSANPLTARVLANRFWQVCFGQGIVATSGDFGYSGLRPSHPELLDWLAREFVRQGWSLKKCVRLLVTSATYRQRAYVNDETTRAKAEAIDASNTLLWRMNPRRLSAEQLRDAMLAVSGALQRHAGGPPAWPELPPEVLQANPAFLDDNSEKTKGWYPSPPEKTHVRTIYLVQKRSVRIPFMETFDLPENFVTCSRRGVSTVAPQAFSLLNNPFSGEMCRALAGRIKQETGDDDYAEIRRAYQVVLGRVPDSKEEEISLRLLRDHGLPHLARALLNTNEFVYVD
ncbi:MAG: DUF1553 domain-containing protein [Verrucomicrobiales bacterium]